MRLNRARWIRRLAPATLLAVVAFAACGDDDPTGVEEADLSGTYELVSITYQGQPSLAPPVATGTFTLTATTYQVSITIDLPDPFGQQIEDNGTYAIDGNDWSQESSANGFQSVGTITYDGTRLEVNATTQGQTVITVWNKTS
jgi:hypothetical protein